MMGVIINRPMRATIGAITASVFITSIVGLLPLSLSYTLHEGALQRAAFILSGAAIAIFFIWLVQHAYYVELELMAEDRALREGRARQ